MFGQSMAVAKTQEVNTTRINLMFDIDNPLYRYGGVVLLIVKYFPNLKL